MQFDMRPNPQKGGPVTLKLLRRNPFMTPASAALVRPNPYMTPATAALVRPNPHRKRSNPLSPTVKNLGGLVIGSAGAVGVNRALAEFSPNWAMPKIVWRLAPVALGMVAVQFGRGSPLAAGFAGGMFYSIFEGLMVDYVKGDIFASVAAAV